MSNTPHTLNTEFPERLLEIHALKAADPAFAAILKEYDQVNDEIHLAETNVHPVAQEHETTLRKQRLLLKDKILIALDRAI